MNVFFVEMLVHALCQVRELPGPFLRCLQYEAGIKPSASRTRLSTKLATEAISKSFIFTGQKLSQNNILKGL